MFRLIDITCGSHIAYALSEHHLPLGFQLGEHSQCDDCRLALSSLNGTALAFSHLPRWQRAKLNAVHESGHAVLHVVFGHVVNFATVADDPDSAGVIGNVNFDAYTTADRMAATAWAGREAVLHQLDRWESLDDASLLDAAYGMRGDWALLTDLGMSHGELETSRASAADLVAEHGQAIDRVAAALLARGRLTGYEIAGLARIPCAT
jgi:hypothetical protein